MRCVLTRKTNHLTRTLAGILATVGAAWAALPGSEALVLQIDESSADERVDERLSTVAPGPVNRC